MLLRTRNKKYTNIPCNTLRIKLIKTNNIWYQVYINSVRYYNNVKIKIDCKALEIIKVTTKNVT